MKVFTVGDEDTVLGFSLAGVEGQVVRDVQEVQSAVRQVMGRKDVGIVLINEKFARMVPALVEQLTRTAKFPLILEIPDRNGPLPERKTVEEIIQSSIGIKI